MDKIVTLANRAVELQLRVFIRSLRSTGCDLPVHVIPYGVKDFDLPGGCQWLEETQIESVLAQQKAHPLYAKYAALVQRDCAYFDTDIVVLQNPSSWLESAPSDSFVVADTEWAKNRWTFTNDSRQFLVSLSSRWPLLTFNSGFFAFEEPVYDEDELIAAIQSPEMRDTCLRRTASPIDQPAINWLVLRKNRKIFNFNLPTQNMESTMAGDYGRSAPERVLSNPDAPAFLHYAGPLFQTELPVTRLFTDYLTASERELWDRTVRTKYNNARWQRRWPLRVRVMGWLTRLLDPRFHVQPRLHDAAAAVAILQLCSR